MKKLVIMMMAVITAVAMLVAGCGGSGDKKEAAGGAKVLRVGTEPAFAPFEFQQEGSKELTGFDIDLVKAVGKQMGYKVEIQNMGFDALIPALEAGNIDVAIAGMSITDERKKVVAFSDPYYTSGLLIMVPKDNTTIKSIEDLKGKRIACQIGTTGEKKSRSIEGATVTAFNTQSEASMEMKNGGADAVINDAPVVAYYLQQGGVSVAKTVGEKMEAEDYGMAVNKNKPELAAEINKAMAELKKNGEFDKIYATWFGEKK